MAHIDPIQRYRSFIKRLNQNIYICPECRQFFNENTPCSCGYHYQDGRQYDYINEAGEFRTNTKELVCIETNMSELLDHFDEINWDDIRQYFIKTGWKYIINNIHITPTVSDLQNTVKSLYDTLLFSKDTSGVISAGWELDKTDRNTVICKFIAKPIYSK